MLEGTLLAASAATALGIVHRAIAPDRLLDEAAATARRLGRRSPVSIRVIKHAVNDSSSRPLGDGLHDDRVGAIVSVGSEQGQLALGELARRHPSSEPLPSGEYLRALAEWQRGDAIDLGNHS
jgi:enoyl-CoA hydratase/carnithine racemase